MIIAPHEREIPLVHAFVRLAGSLATGYDVIDLFQELCEACVTLVGADAAGLVLSDQRGGLRAVAVSAEHAEIADVVRRQADEGPGRDCFDTSAAVHAPDLSTGSRWPGFTALAVEAGVVAAYALPMHLRGRTIGALTLVHRTADAMDEADLHVGQALADTATIAILTDRTSREQEELAEQLQAALTSRVVVEQATGVLAERGGTGTDEAFRRMLDHAAASGERLSDVARGIVDGSLDTGSLVDG